MKAIWRNEILLVGITLIVFPFLAVSQKPTIKVYGNFAMNGAIAIPVFDNKSLDVLDFRWFSIAARFSKKKHRYKELEITDFFLQRTPSTDVDIRFSIGFRYEAGRLITKNKASRLTLRGGLSLRTYLGIEQLNGLNPLGLPVENRIFGLSVGTTPHIEYKLTKHLIFDFSPFIELTNIAVRSEYVFDDAIDEEARQSLDFYFKGMQPFFRFGLGWAF